MSWKPLDNLDRVPSLPEGASVIDSHCHLDAGDFDPDRGAVLARAAQVGVSAMVTIGAGGRHDCNRAALRLAAERANVFATVGTHPHEASQVSEAVIEELRRLAGEPKVVAIGETGLDYHYDNSPRPAQREAFRRFVQLARELRLPLVVHLREADGDAIEILRSENAAEIGGVIHCFSGDAASARRLLDLGFHLSFSGILTFKTAAPIRDAARITPADRLMVETDAPFLAPIPYRGRRNEPALVVLTATALAEVRGESPAEVAFRTAENTRRLFRLPAG